MPLETFGQGSTKFHRLFREGLHIWRRDSKLNVLGSKTWRGDPGGANGIELLTPKVKRFKLVKRLRELHMRNVDVDNVKEDHNNKKEEATEALRRKGKTMSMIGRLARRPLYKQEGFLELGIAKQVRSLEPRGLVQLVKQGFRILDGANQSIFMANITKIVNDKENVVFTAASVKSVLNVEPLVGKACREEIQCMCRRWTRRGVVVFVRTSVGTRAGKTVTSVYGNTTRWAKKQKEEFA
jgi:hypothetical protein